MSKIELNDVSVSYIVGDFSNVGLKDVIIQKIKGTYTQKEFLAVDHVTFSLDEGELLGIVGSNGAGKSTLLKVISGIMRPTNGTMAVNGSIASLLELGTGFDGDLTVKENTFLRGAMLGYTREFMNETYKSIIDFAELQDFEDRKFSHLSSGMKSRLAFSIACLVKPEILILDEVLSVGDGAFRKKSEDKMFEIIKGGATTLLVSHSISQIRRMATKVLWLDKGKQIAFGDTKEICDKYEAFLKTK
ncbi:ABC transporter ATP-binding protein [Ruminococcus sp. XPD3002]|uniref:ABC transporter ATP-binding protein n=1 Tax=Ruminococcus sp. XPD3002 TaxID=1452269 RepID=UPI000922A84F|nr:ABC transporter ATP-binding protein [Ruminococcus sp.]SFX71918.1 ABC-2 type transport system ATP-binding protein [Ruminococcus flavefaciens]HPY85650.1 ABC transporter ATP-binding protein [Ruminococcus flavefaciens]HRU97935.1 ABC transporter ATP-binding protein [Ruminococcus sp.]